MIVAENIATLSQARFQTLPVCQGGLDHLLGLLDAKDFLGRLLKGEKLDIAAATHAAVFVPESITAVQLLETLRRRRSHLALIVDEYGAIEGMVTLTDLLEAIIGDLPSAATLESDDAVRREDGSWSVDGRLNLERIAAMFELPPLAGSSGDYHTLGGLSMDQLGRVPAVGDIFEWRGLRFEVIDMDRNRVDRVLVEKAPPASG